jgi:hypothetical protein
MNFGGIIMSFLLYIVILVRERCIVIDHQYILSHKQKEKENIRATYNFGYWRWAKTFYRDVRLGQTASSL